MKSKLVKSALKTCAVASVTFFSLHALASTDVNTSSSFLIKGQTTLAQESKNTTIMSINDANEIKVAGRLRSGFRLNPACDDGLPCPPPNS